MRLNEMRVRDPFVLPWNGRYYLYSSFVGGLGFDVYVSDDLTTWDGPKPVFRPSAGFWATRDFWAPEAHVYRGRVYLFGSVKSDTACRGTQIFVADTPLGPFVPLTPEPVTPRDWECLDGTLYVEHGKPYMVFCHEWLQVFDGEMCAMPLSDDLSRAVGEPTLLFRASEAKWVLPIQKIGDAPCYVTDGPCLFQERDQLTMAWSSFGAEGYAVGLARSEGGVNGPWRQMDEPIFARDGGHCMCFTGYDSVTRVALHQPNRSPDERPVLIELS